MRMRGVVGILLLCAVSVGVMASGTLIYEQSAAAAAQAGAVVARPNDATAVFYNPAGLAFQKNADLQFNMTYINADVKYESPSMGNFKDNAKNFFLPAVYFSMPINDRVSFGIMANAPYDLATDWSGNFPGRWASRHAKIVTMNVRPVLAFKLDDHHAFSIGADYYDSQLDLYRSVNTSALSTAINPNRYPSPPYPPGIPYYAPSEGRLMTHLRNQAWGWNVGYMYKNDPFSLGLFYSSKAKFNYSGHTSIRSSAAIGPLAAYFPGEGTKLSLDSVPASARFGFAYSGNPLQVEFDVTWTQWSSWSKSMAHFSNPTSYSGVPLVADEEFVFDWKDTWCYRLGFTYTVNPNWDLRWGLLYDQAPVPDKTLSPVLPDANRWSVQFGTGYHKGAFNLDWYVMYLKFSDANITSSNMYRYGSTGLPDVYLPGQGQIYPTSYPITPDGKYVGTAWLSGIQMGWKF